MLLAAILIRGLFILLFLIIASTLPARAQSSTPEITVTASENSVTIFMSLDLTENFTSLPLFTIHLGGTNSSVASKPIATAMQKLVPSARIDDLTLVAQTSVVDPTTGTWRLQENYTIQVSGVNNNLGSTVESKLDFLSMNVSAPISVQGFELNNVGGAYLLQRLLSLRAQQLAQNIQSTRYFFEKVPYTNTVVPGNGTLTFNLLDFTWVLPLIGWAHHDDQFAPTSSWLLPAYIVLPYNLTVGFVQREATYIPIYEALYDPSIQITAPPRAVAKGNTIVFDQSAIAEIVMPLIIAASLVISLGVFVADRRLTRPLRTKKKKR
jgi:hypothetical protein